MMQRLYPLTGSIISLFIALLGYVLRSYREEAISSLFTFAGSFANVFVSWLVVQSVIQLDKPRWHGWKAAIAIAACMCISLLLFYGIQDIGKIRGRVAALPRGMRIVYFLLLMRGVVLGGFLYYIAYLLRMAEVNQRSRLENERLKKENLQARLSLLQEQVSPHFLFNSLGTLQSMINERAPRQFIHRLADVYRYLLNNRMADLVELRAELDFARAYLYILQERFEQALFVDIDIAEHYLEMKIPPMTLQVLVENAVKHNVADAEAPLHLQISATGTDRLTVTNSLRPKPSQGDSLGTGLDNTRERYRLLAGRDIDVLKTGHTFTVSVPLLNDPL
ncbi:sensor histidine kinase [Parapedobacter sp. GCM10030251]|uniref:sensor histidine kinase n=1 Tax=Parapedobacter sp. GCM10030251 TaxID=3273419 RepID=UPI003620FD3D